VKTEAMKDVHYLGA